MMPGKTRHEQGEAARDFAALGLKARDAAMVLHLSATPASSAPRSAQAGPICF
jgi:hypothetical protein